MSGIIPRETVDIMRSFNDLGVRLYGIRCTLFVPTNLTALEPNDAYTCPEDITYKRHNDVAVWIEWHAKNIVKLRKLGFFAEGEAPIVARFQNLPEVTINSYIKVETAYIPDSLDTDEFELVDVIMTNTYDSEIFRYYKLAPRRAK
jgi:hypothetical protein